MRESENQYDSDGAVMNGFDYGLHVWVVGGVVKNCGHRGDSQGCCNARRYATQAVKFIEGHEVRP